MRRRLLIAIAFAVGIWVYLLVGGPVMTRQAPGAGGSAPSGPPANPEDGITALFSPMGGFTEAIVAELNAATKSVDLQAYTFTSSPVAQALVDALNRGVRVRVVLDKSHRVERSQAAAFLLAHNIPVYIDDQHAIAHNKVVLIDGHVLITGSFNFTKASEEKNAENLLIIKDRPKLIGSYQANFDRHLGHSTLYTGTAR